MSEPKTGKNLSYDLLLYVTDKALTEAQMNTCTAFMEKYDFIPVNFQVYIPPYTNFGLMNMTAWDAIYTNKHDIQKHLKQLVLSTASSQDFDDSIVHDSVFHGIRIRTTRTLLNLENSDITLV